MLKVRSAAITLIVALALATALGLALDWTQTPVHAAEASTAASGDAILSVAHFAPFATNAPGTAVTVTVNGSAAITNFVFPNVVKGIPLAPGTYTFGVQLPDGTPIITVTTDLMTDTEYLVAAIGGVNGFTPTLYPLVVDRTPATDTGKVRITHLAPFTSSVAATAVDVCNDVTDSPIITQLQFLSTTGYLNLLPAAYDLSVAVAGSDCATTAINLPPFRVRAGQTIEVIARGLLPGSADPSLDIGVYVDGQAGVAVAHFAPFASTITGTAVTVRVDGSDVLTDFVFPSITGYLNLAPGDHLVQILPKGSSTPVISETVPVDPLVEYTLAAVGTITTSTTFGLKLETFVNDNATQPVSGTVRMRVAHLAPFAPTLAGTEVDLCGTSKGTPILNNVPFGASAVISPTAGVLNSFVSVPNPNCSESVLPLPVWVLKNQQIANVYVVGGANGLPLQVVKQSTEEFVEAELLFEPIVKVPED